MYTDLISRKELLKNLKSLLNKSFLGETTAQTEISVGTICTLINECPTAYNLDAVVEGLLYAKGSICCYLNELGCNDDCEHCGVSMLCEDVLKVVETGSGNVLNEEKSAGQTVSVIYEKQINPTQRILQRKLTEAGAEMEKALNTLAEVWPNLVKLKALLDEEEKENAKKIRTKGVSVCTLQQRHMED